MLKMVTNSLGNRNFMQAMGRLSMHSWWALGFSFWGVMGEIFWFFSLVPIKFPLGSPIFSLRRSQYHLKFYPICFAQRSSTLMYINWKGRLLGCTFVFTSGYPWPSDTVRHKRNVSAPSFLELQRERRDMTELGYPGRCRRQPRKHTGPVPVHPLQRAWFMARDLGLRGETGLRHRPGSTHLGATRPGPGFFLSFGSLKPGHWDLGPGLVGTQDSGLGGQF
jgi:hypothetical protein